MGNLVVGAVVGRSEMIGRTITSSNWPTALCLSDHQTSKGASMKLPFSYMLTQLDAPNAVNTAVITDAIICSVHLMVSFFVIVLFSLVGF